MQGDLVKDGKSSCCRHPVDHLICHQIYKLFVCVRVRNLLARSLALLEPTSVAVH